MTKDEIKATPLSEILRSRYGIEGNRARMIRCPFHEDGTPSLRLYRDSAYCFGCGWSGDIFKFVMDYEGIDFRKAFLSLGGTYDSSPAEITKAVKKTIFRREIAAAQEEVEEEDYRKWAEMLTLLRGLPEAENPYSTAWCAVQECCLMIRRYDDRKRKRGQGGTASEAS